MSLNYSLVDIAGADELCWHRVDADSQPMQFGFWSAPRKVENGVTFEMQAVTMVLQFLCMTLGMDGIHAKNSAEFTERLALWQACQGAMLRDGEERDIYITGHDVVAHIGLHVNVEREARTKWYKRIVPTLVEGAVEAQLQHNREVRGE